MTDEWMAGGLVAYAAVSRPFPLTKRRRCCASSLWT